MIRIRKLQRSGDVAYLENLFDRQRTAALRHICVFGDDIRRRPMASADAASFVVGQGVRDLCTYLLEPFFQCLVQTPGGLPDDESSGDAKPPTDKPSMGYDELEDWGVRGLGRISDKD